MTFDAGSQKRKALIVDDHPLVREWLTNLINQQPDLAVCGEAEARPQALQAVVALKPDIVIVDIALKGSSGIELIKDVTHCCPGVAVLVLSMHEEPHYAERALRAGAMGYVMKRETSRKVITAIRQVLGGKMYVSAHVAGAMAAQPVRGRTLPAQSPAEVLGHRELEVFELIGQGRGTRQIAEMLRVSIKTVEAHCAHIKEKLGLAGAGELLREAVRWCEQTRLRESPPAQ